MTDTDNTLLFVNRAFCQTYGYSSEELIGNNISMVRTPNEMREISISEILNETLRGGWSGEAMQLVTDDLKAIGLDVIEPGVRAQYLPNGEDTAQIIALAEKIIEKIK